MTSYISTASISTAMRQSVLRIQSELSDANTELNTGNFADVGLTLGADTGQSVSLQADEAYLQTITNTNTTVSTRLSTTQTILSTLQTAAQDLQNSLIQNNGSVTNASEMQAQAQTDLQSLTAALNTTLNGDYIFGGVNTGEQPITNYPANQDAVNTAFSDFMSANGIADPSDMTGDQMQSFLSSSGPFSSLFQGASWTSDWSSASDTTLSNQIGPEDTENTSVSANQAPFQQLAQAYSMLTSLGTANLSSDAYQTVVSKAETLLSSAVNGLTDLQANVGTVQARVDSSTDQMSLQMNILTTQVSNLESVDPFEAQTRVSDLQTQLQTAYSLTSQLQKLSLVNYL